MSIIIEFHNLKKTEILDKNQKQTRAFYIVDKDKKMLQINTIPDSQMSLPVDQIKSFSQTILFDESGMKTMSGIIDSIIGTTVASAQRTNDSLPLQQIFYGAPGTGKSHKVKEVTDKLPKSDVFRTTFHPDSDYSTFVGCYKPKMVKAPIRDSSGHEITSACEEEKKRIAYEYEPQAFLKAYVRAYETNEPVFLVIEEINRGNCAQIFGDMFQLLDRNDNGESDYAIKPETAVQDFLREKLKDCDIADDAVKSGDEMRLPGNLFIWGTMNTSDQSLFPIDSAFKRRWDWQYMPIDTTKEQWTIKVNDKGYSWGSFLDKVNDEIGETTSSEDKKLGFYFCKAFDKTITAERFVSKVLFYVYNDVFKDYGLDSREFFKDKETGKVITFQSLFNKDGSVNEPQVEKLLINLKVTTTDASTSSTPSSGNDDDSGDSDDGSDAESGRDRTKYMINGQGPYVKKNLAKELVTQYVAKNPLMTPQQVVSEWRTKIGTPVSHFIETEEEFLKRADIPRSAKIPCSDSFIYVSVNGWSGADMMRNLIAKVEAQGWGLNVEEVEQ